METSDVLLKIKDEELMDKIRGNDKMYVAGVKYKIDGYTIGPDPDTDNKEEIMIATLERVFKKNVLRCELADCTGELLKVEDERYHGGHRWQCNYCGHVRE